MALSEEAKKAARELGLPEELPPRSNKPLTEEDWAKIEAKIRAYAGYTILDEDLDEETRELVRQLDKEIEADQKLHGN